MPHRAILDDLRPDDAEAISRALRDPQILRWLPEIPVPSDIEDARKIIADKAAGHRAIRLEGELIGVVRAKRDLNIWLMPEFHRRGLALRAAILALTRAFQDGATQITASHAPDNLRAATLLARLGFRDAGTRASRSQRGQPPRTVRRLTLGRADFSARHAIAITTPRLRIETIQPVDLPELRRIATLPEVARMLFLFHRDMPDEDFSALFPIEALLRPYRLAVRQRGALIGSIGVGGGAMPSIYYFLDPVFSGRGLGAELVTAFVGEILARYDLDGLQAEVFTDNPASRRLLEKAGFAVVEETPLVSRGRDGPAPGWILQRPAKPPPADQPQVAD